MKIKSLILCLKKKIVGLSQYNPSDEDKRCIKEILLLEEELLWESGPITNENWEKDEYKALHEFCDNFSISYDVLAVSFFSKQVAIKLKICLYI